MDLVPGGGVGQAFNILYNAVKSIAIKNMKFKPTLEKITRTVEALKPLLEDIEKSNEKLDEQKWELSGFKTAMEEGANLIRKCSEVHGYNIFKRSSGKDELDELDETLRRLINILGVQGMRDQKETGIELREMHDVIMRKGDIGFGVSNTSTASCDVPQLPSLIKGLDGPLAELKKRLLNSDKSLLLVTAMGGCGKTLLAQKFCHDLHVKGKFKDNIFFVTVSKTAPSLSDIVQQLYKHKKKEVPALANEVDAVEHLKILLNQIGEIAPILLVLDDVWDGSESLVKRLVLQRPEYKILVTSRSELKGLGPPEFAHPYRLIPLNDKDAMTLFCHWASLDDGNSGISDKIVKEIVDYFKIFPLGLKIVAGTLSGKSEEFWKSKLRECSNASSKLSTESDLVACLQSLLENLDAKVKECFMDLGSFPEDHRIPVAALIDMWTELYNLNEDGDAVVELLNLVCRNLVSLIVTRKDMKEVDGYYNKHFVTQHDLLRDLTMHQSSNDPGQWKRLNIDLRGKNQLPNWWDKRKEKSFSARLLTISSEKKLPSKLSKMELPEAEALLLNFWSKDYALPEFVEKMESLKALIITSYKTFPAELKNFELLGPLENLRRIRLERISIPSLTLVPLGNLQKISFYMCSIGKAFSNCSTKISELFPNLTEMNVDFCNDLVELPAEICDIETLEELTISHCTKLCALPEEIGKLENLKELRLRCCISLVGLPDSISKLSNLAFLDISDCISIESLPEDIGDLRKLSKLNMTHCSRLPTLPWSVSNLAQLEDLICDEEKQELWEPFLLPYLPNTVVKLAEVDINLNWLPQYRIA
ncbi:hypothetical protein FNV43_RR17194 [Rhamnella rubrinervis]|uniref:RPW8 domain-containing protein n=1 Tax=Rhamnella rubrinervis TaxID=2594499 RepID=A0A8K0E3M1_9ROSA|nr:hypothetical protein FNV43_RR17194 [Rhamnella rubrinervis]